MISYLAEDFGLHLTSMEPIDGGVDRAAQNFRGYVGSAAYAIKWSTGGSAAGLVVPHALANRGTSGVAAAVPTRDGRLWSNRDGRRLSVAPWVGDRRGIDGGLDAVQWRAFGEVMAAAHALPVTAELSTVLPLADHRGDLAHARAVDELLRGADPVDAIAAEVQQSWLRAADRIARVAARVEALAPLVEPSVVCHTDAHLGNVLAGPDRIWLIDWDDAALSVPEHDLMFVLGGMYGDEHIGDAQRAWFFEGYGPARIDAQRLAYWRGARGLVDLAFLAREAFTPGDYGDTWRRRAADMVAANLAPGGIIAMVER